MNSPMSTSAITRSDVPPPSHYICHDASGESTANASSL
jgi:hypothetical protein